MLNMCHSVFAIYYWEISFRKRDQFSIYYGSERYCIMLRFCQVTFMFVLCLIFGQIKYMFINKTAVCCVIECPITYNLDSAYLKRYYMNFGSMVVFHFVRPVNLTSGAFQIPMPNFMLVSPLKDCLGYLPTSTSQKYNHRLTSSIKGIV